jgi:hypothetical protein
VDSFRQYLTAVNPETPILARLIELLRSRYDYVVIGAHARNAYADPRATRDLDVILADGDLDALLAEIPAVVPRARIVRKGGFLTVKRGKKPVLDVGLASAHPLYEATLRGATRKRVPALGLARIATREALVALKLLSALSPARRFPKSLQDQADAATLLDQRLDRRRLARLVSLVPGGKELLAALERAARDRAAGPRNDSDE